MDESKPCDPPDVQDLEANSESRTSNVEGPHTAELGPMNSKPLTLDPQPNDIPIMQRQEIELRRLSAIVRNAIDAVIIRAIDGRILAWNRGAELMYGYTESEALGMSFSTLLPLDVQSNMDVLNDNAVSDDLAASSGSRRVTKDGRTVNVWQTVTRLTDPSGSLEAIATTERDITPIKKAEDTIRLLQAELAHIGRVHAVGEFAAAMAHELNQPLCAIGVNAQAVKGMIRGQVPADEIQAALKDILDDVDRAGKVLGSLRDQLRKCEPEYTTLDINDVVEGIAPIAGALARSEKVGILYHLGESLPSILGDRIQLQQVVLNLIRNGIEAMRDTGGEQRELLIETKVVDESSVGLSVTDCGIGLSDSVIERMFEPFFTTKPDGMGMGLAISSSIVTAHGGRLWGGRTELGGACVQFTLPALDRVVGT